MPVHRHLDGRIGRLVVGQGKVALGLPDVDRVDAVAQRVDHVQLAHGGREERITVAVRRAIARDVVGRPSLEEAPAVPEREPINVLRDDDTLSPRIILVRNAVVECFQDALLIVLRHLCGQHLVFGQDPNLHIADA